MINQDYAWGQDSKKDFTWSMEKLYPNAKAGEDQLPKFGAGQYGTEISALMAKPADVTHSSLWGGDLQAFMLQAGPRGLFTRTQVVFSAADHVLPGLGEKMPDGVILGARGAYGLMSPKCALNDWWWDLYSQGLQRLPGAGPVPHGAEPAGPEAGGRKGNGRQRRQEAHRRADSPRRCAAWNGSQPAGKIRMALGDGHQAIQDTAIGRTRYDAAKKMVVLDDIQRFPAGLRQPAGQHEGRGLDQGRLPWRQGLPVEAAAPGRLPGLAAHLVAARVARGGHCRPASALSEPGQPRSANTWPPCSPSSSTA